MKDKRIRRIAGTVLIVSVFALFYLQNGRSMMVYSSHSMSSANCHEENLIVVANRLFIPDKEECAEEIVRKCRENDFENILFSYDYALPNALHVTVYRSEWAVSHGNPSFELSYTQDKEDGYPYNIVDDPQHFKMEIH
ncbi:hypothetical protein [Thomasclavelia sp.]